MQVIIVHRWRPTPLVLQAGRREASYAAAAMALVCSAWWTFGTTQDAPVSAPMAVASSVEANAQRTQLDDLAQRVAAMQQRVAELDAATPVSKQAPALKGAGGPALALAAPAGGLLLPARDMSANELAHALDRLDLRLNGLTALPPPRSTQPIATTMPLAIGWITSPFGPRTDPITGGRARHEGQDFAAPTGTPILAAAAGVVLDARTHPEYGMVVDVDHGNEVVTRYAHASALLVRQGDLVRRGQAIGRVGSTGRSTGPHLHFEVRVAGVAIDPVRFLGPAAQVAQR